MEVGTYPVSRQSAKTIDAPIVGLTTSVHLACDASMATACAQRGVRPIAIAVTETRARRTDATGSPGDAATVRIHGRASVIQMRCVSHTETRRSAFARTVTVDYVGTSRAAMTTIQRLSTPAPGTARVSTHQLEKERTVRCVLRCGDSGTIG